MGESGGTAGGRRSAIRPHWPNLKISLFSRHPSGDFRVTDYRAYPVGADGHFIGYEPLICADDKDAIEKARRLVVDHDVELWCGERMVIRLRPGTK
jgi:hypothetical protein